MKAIVTVMILIALAIPGLSQRHMSRKISIRKPIVVRKAKPKQKKFHEAKPFSPVLAQNTSKIYFYPKAIKNSDVILIAQELYSGSGFYARPFNPADPKIPKEVPIVGMWKQIEAIALTPSYICLIGQFDRPEVILRDVISSFKPFGFTIQFGNMVRCPFLEEGKDICPSMPLFPSADAPLSVPAQP